MSLDALTALSLASSVVQFIDFGSKLFSKSRELYKNSTNNTTEDRQLEIIAQFLQRLSDNLDAGTVNTTRPSPAESDLNSLTEECKTIAEELLAALEKLKTRDPRKKWDCIRVSLKRIWKSEMIDDLARRLHLCSSQITTCLVQLLNDKQSNVVLSLQHLAEASERSQSRVDLNMENLRLTSLDILKKLETIHQDHTSNIECDGKRGQINASRLRELSFKLDSMANTGARLVTEYRILESLLYKRMEMREARISHAHACNFEWIFDRPDDDSPDEPSSETHFVDWLTGSGGVFWITGKAGSGKSTLMKFLSHHKLSRKALQHWAGDKKLVISSFYFWYAGTELQNSQEGLLQSLLHSVLTQCPDLIEVVLPRRWKECNYNHTSTSHWTRAELMDAFTELNKQTTISTKFCFFVDGLDEYCGDHQEIATLLQGFSKSDHIKTCLSSRPWNVFALAFGRASCPKLRLEELTRDDIQIYVRDTLEKNELFQRRKQREAHQCDNLVIEVVQKASGVFLWVFLVVRSLLQGLTNADRVVDLQRRLRRFPSDLEEYFKHTLGTVDDNYHEQMGRMFLTALHASEPLTLMTYVMMDEIEENPGFALDLDIRPMKLSEINSRHEDMKLRLNARCKDLLEFTKLKAPSHHQDQDVVDAPVRGGFYEEVLPRISLCSNPFFEYEVDFLHRTVRDFLQIREIHEVLVKSAAEGLNPNAVLSHAFLAQIKTVPLRADQLIRAGPFSDLVDDMMYYACEFELQKKEADVLLLDELSHTYKSRVKALPASISFTTPSPIDPSLTEMRRSFVTFALQRRLVLYVTEKLDLQLDQVLANVSLEHLIAKAISPCIVSKYKLEANPEIVRFLLQKERARGHEVEIQSIWNLQINHLVNNICLKWVGDTATTGERQSLLESIIVLLDSGADPTRDHKWIEFIFMPRLNWCEYDIAFLLSQTIVKLLDNGVKPDALYKDCTVWSHFLKGICHSHHISTSKATSAKRSKPIEWKGHALNAVQKFLAHEADRECNLSGLSEKYSAFEGLSVKELLSCIFSAEQIATLGLDKKKPLTASSVTIVPPTKSKPKVNNHPRRRWRW